MAEVESIKCPNCGASVRGAGAVTCPYCGSSLEVKSDLQQKREVKRALGAVGVDMGVEPPFFFQNLPGAEIKRETVDIPFKPVVVYSHLAGGEPTGTLRAEADAILEVMRQTQEAVNREDMAAYMACITETHKKFRAQAQQGANAQFVTTDMKRYTVAADFRKLTADKAEVVVTVEVFIFFDSGKVNHLQVPFYWKMRKERGRWIVYGSGVSGAGGGSKLWILVVSILLPIVIGIIAAIIGGVSECRDDSETYVPDEGEGDVWKAESRKKPMPDKWFRARGDLTLYDSPTDDPDVEAVLKAGGEFKLLGYYDGWFHVSTRNNTWGWVPEDVMKKHLGSEFNDIPR
jgi:DNA-directed RNA polymerase subunit RPC12/RpoP